jgi:hypothetical protein
MAQQETQSLKAKVDSARAFVLVDGDGNERACLAATPSGKHGAVVLHLHDAEGRPRIMLQVDSEGNPSIALFTKVNSPAISLALNSSRGNGLTIGNSDGVPCIDIGVPKRGPDYWGDDHPRITVRDHEGEELWSIPGNK